MNLDYFIQHYPSILYFERYNDIFKMSRNFSHERDGP